MSVVQAEIDFRPALVRWGTDAHTYVNSKLVGCFFFVGVKVERENKKLFFFVGRFSFAKDFPVFVKCAFLHDRRRGGWLERIVEMI